MSNEIDIKEWFIMTVEILEEEWASGEYMMLEDCPMYDEAETYRKAMNYLAYAVYMPEDAEKMQIPTIEELILR